MNAKPDHVKPDYAQRDDKWMIMVYLATDEILANYAIESLKLLKDTADNNVSVAAQVGFEGSDPATCHRYIFRNDIGSKPPAAEELILAQKSINAPEFRKLNDQPPENVDMTDPSTLTKFIDWAYQNRGDANHYCLILWGHGPELLHEDPVRNQNDSIPSSGRRRGTYFTPVELKGAIENTNLKQERPAAAFEIIGMDACSMSTFEYAYELKDLADFMVASQEEVSDLSFPYDMLLKLFSAYGSDVEKLCELSVKAYAVAYQDAITDFQTGMRPITLSALRLKALAEPVGLAGQLESLVGKLREAARTDDGAKAILGARSDSQGFVGGLFVDLCDFCDKLASRQGTNQDLRRACNDVCQTIKLRKEANACIVANEVGRLARQVTGFDPDSCHGLSIYFPFLSDEDEENIATFRLLKGLGGDGRSTPKGLGGDGRSTPKGLGGDGRSTPKGLGGDGRSTPKGLGGDGRSTPKNVLVVNEIAVRIQYDVRRRVIEDTEDYYSLGEAARGTSQEFTFATRTHWYDFIRCDWSRILRDLLLDELDLRYSAAQCAKNLRDAPCANLLKECDKSTYAKANGEAVPRGIGENSTFGTARQHAEADGETTPCA
jgi:hypothetical protein